MDILHVDFCMDDLRPALSQRHLPPATGPTRTHVHHCMQPAGEAPDTRRASSLSIALCCLCQLFRSLILIQSVRLSVCQSALGQLVMSSPQRRCACELGLAREG